MLKPTRFMRQPFFVMGYQVTLDNMDELAKWCEGHVIRDAERPFVRVPVNRPTHVRQTEAYVGTWILISKQRGVKSFKVYTEEWLAKNFCEVFLDNEIDVSDMIPTTTPSPSSNVTSPFRFAEGR